MPSECGLGGQDAPEGFPASWSNAYLSGAKAFFADVYYNEFDVKPKVRYRVDGAPKNAGHRPFSRPTPLKGLGRAASFGITCPCPRLGPRPTHNPDGSPLKIDRNKWGPVQGMSWGGPLTGAGRKLPKQYPPQLGVRVGHDGWKPAQPHPATNTSQTPFVGANITLVGIACIIMR